MHDPYTQAFTVGYPWSPWVRRRSRLRDEARLRATMTPREAKERAHGWAPPMLVVWHRDKGGCDGACGWSYPRLSDAMRARLKVLAWNESRHPYFLRCRAKEWLYDRSEAEVLYRGLVLAVADYAHIPLTFEQAARMATRRIHSSDEGDFASALCFLPGYHSNFAEDTPPHREWAFMETVCGIARGLLRERRPWWRHPRFHFWHWRIQVPAWQRLRRWWRNEGNENAVAVEAKSDKPA